MKDQFIVIMREPKIGQKHILVVLALKITKTSYFLKYLKEYSPLFGIKTFDLKKTMGIKITKKESFDINNRRDLLYANQFFE